MLYFKTIAHAYYMNCLEKFNACCFSFVIIVGLAQNPIQAIIQLFPNWTARGPNVAYYLTHCPTWEMIGFKIFLFYHIGLGL